MTAAGTFWDTHIHLEQYGARADSLLRESREAGVEALVAVSMNLESCRRTAALAAAHPDLVRPAYGFHPEQPLPDAAALDALFQWIGREREKGGAFAVGEVGLPYYTKREALQAGLAFDEQPYVALLERFMACAARWDAPVVLHAVYEDAHKALDMLERHRVRRAHFHWFKGDAEAVRRIVRGGYYVSFTPDCLYDEETKPLIGQFPLELMLTETDGPWPFEGPFSGRDTHPSMVRCVVGQIAETHGLTAAEAAEALARNAATLYNDVRAGS